MDAIILFIYLALGYWATGKTIYRNKILIEFQSGGIFCERLMMGAILGWLLIPLAILREVLGI